MSTAKTEKRAGLWNVTQKRFESLHESKEAAENAGRKFLEKSGSQRDFTDLAAVEFTVPLPEPPADHSAETKKAEDLAEKRAKEDGDRSAERAKEDAKLVAKVSADDAARVTTHLSDAPKEEEPDAPTGHAEGSDK